MTEFERPQRAPLPRPSSTSQLQLGHAGARGGELGGGEPTTGARLRGLGKRLAITKAGRRAQRCAVWADTNHWSRCSCSWAICACAEVTCEWCGNPLGLISWENGWLPPGHQARMEVSGEGVRQIH